MALTGTGKLLSYLTHRSIRIALLPSVGDMTLQAQRREGQLMKDFATQLKDVVVDCALSNTTQSRLEEVLVHDGHVMGFDDIAVNTVYSTISHGCNTMTLTHLFSIHSR